MRRRSRGGSATAEGYMVGQRVVWLDGSAGPRAALVVGRTPRRVRIRTAEAWPVVRWVAPRWLRPAGPGGLRA